MELDWFSILWLAVLGVIIFFRAYQLGSIPGEMVSDHAEKLLDVRDVLSGQYSIFFPRNTGREAFQFYLAAATVKLLGTGITFLTLKIGTVLAGLVALPFMYKLGRELGGKWLGLLTMAMAGVAYWPNVISRVGLRFPLFPLFVAPVMFYMVRGLLHRRRNDFLLAGLAVGIGLHGYSPSRVIPILMIVGVVIYMLHRQSRGRRWAAFSWLIGAGIIALIVVVPLLRVTVEMPDMVGYRMLTRMGSEERALPGSAIGIFLNNVGKALAMFANDNGEVWVVSIPHRPALDIVSATFFHLGAVLVFVRYLRRRHWFDLLVLLSIPILQLPSSLSLAFPEENPITNRTAGAIIPVFLIAAIGVMALIKMIDKQWGQTVLLKRIMWAGVGLMLIMSAMLNYDLVFDEYNQQYRQSAWNTSDAGRLIRNWYEYTGTFDTAHIVAYPYWLDTRMPGFIDGDIGRDYAIWPESFGTLQEETRAQFFILNPLDEDGLAGLEAMFPGGWAEYWSSGMEGKDFILYFVPPVDQGDFQPLDSMPEETNES